jgi:AraC family transcriptional regulator
VTGVFEESYSGRIGPATCTAGTVLVRPAGEPHADRFADGGAHDVAIEIDDGTLGRLHAPRMLQAVGAWQDRHFAVLTRRIIGELEIGDQASSLALEALALEVFAFICRTTNASVRCNTHPAWLRRVRDFIRDEWPDRAISLSDLAAIAGVHPHHVARVYKMRFGETPAESIRRLRLAWVAEQLVASRHSLSDIALEAGFADQSHFTRTFRAAFGTTPHRWRTQARHDLRDLRDLRG